MLRRRFVSAGVVGLASLAVLDGRGGRVPAAEAKKRAFEWHKDVIYADTDGVALCMDVFTPTGPKNGVGIIDMASGAWHSDRGKIRDHMMAQVYDIFCDKGYTVFAVRPGSISRFSIQDMIKHLRVATKWVQDHAGQYGIDKNNLGLTGGSAGGHLSALLVVSTRPGKDGKLHQPFKAVGIFFPPTDFSTSAARRPTSASRRRPKVRPVADGRPRPGGQKVRRGQGDRAGPGHLAGPARRTKQPPFLIIHGDADPVVPLHQSEMLVEAFKKQGGSAELIVKKGGGHPWFTIHEEVKVMADWFDKELVKKHE